MNGHSVPACANSRLMQEIARDTWGFRGYVVSDCGAVNNIGQSPLPSPRRDMTAVPQRHVRLTRIARHGIERVGGGGLQCVNTTTHRPLTKRAALP